MIILSEDTFLNRCGGRKAKLGKQVVEKLLPKISKRTGGLQSLLR